ncbi:MAG: FUSC family protein [Rothia sp. (in: high G+C Gram-positive bacteria)]|nr:FUSC family protein [Rothia sp. (in: high G+C Gram-positive bacteria)]
MGFGQQVESVKKRARDHSHLGWQRMKDGFFQSLQIVVSGIGAYLFAEKVLGHTEPIFAATAAIVSLGYITGATHARRIFEVSVGVTLGILMGDIMMLFLGRGIWQAGLVMFLSIMLARFLDNGIIFTIQMGLQSCLVVLLPPNIDGPFARSLDAIVGGLCAFLLMFLFPKDPRRAPRENARKMMGAFSAVFRDAGEAMEHYNSQEAWHALASARRLQPLYNTCEKDIITSKGMAQLAWTGRSHMKELDRYSQTLTKIDYAIRNTRVLNRRLASTINNVQISQEAITSIAEALKSVGNAVEVLGEGMSDSNAEVRNERKAKARHELSQLAGGLEPHMMGVRTMEAEALVLMLRPLVVDLLEASGLTHQQAVDMLVPLGDSMTEHAPTTTVLPVQASATAGSQQGSHQQRVEQKHRDDTRQLTTVLRAKDSAPLRESSLRDPRSMPVVPAAQVDSQATTELHDGVARVEKQQALNTAQLTIIERNLKEGKED